ncbi:GMC oxidoreductase [Pseudaquabacterium rugosum]|uniref:GMC oxidoreductase n=1 Tax=Pseudaquabacterium rugosum TaxID=2984194 RepID=A0ABU9BEG9_9BURK
MIVPLNETRDEQLLDHDVCVVGGGAVGLALADRLLARGLRVLLIEAGGRDEHAAYEDAYDGHAEAPHPPTRDYRRQRLGGTTHLWGGRCVPFDEIDFLARDWVPDSGWPLRLEALQPWITEATAIADAGLADFGTTALPQGDRPLFDGLQQLSGRVDERIERYSLPTDFGRKYGAALQAHPRATVVLQAKVMDLVCDGEGRRIVGLTLRCRSSGRLRTARAREVVLAAGGIEATRLLLATRAAQPGWAHLDAHLGRHYTCHFDVILGRFETPGQLPRFGFERTRDGVYARRKLQLSATVQREHRLLNGCFRLHFPAYGDPSHGSGVMSLIHLLKSSLPREHQKILNHGHGHHAGDRQRLAHLRNVLLDAPAIARFATDYLLRIRLATRKLPYTLERGRTQQWPLEFNGEQLPTASNRITLLDARDADGLPRVHVHWALTPQDIDSARRSFELLAAELARSGRARLHLPARDALEQALAAALPVGGHHMGSTRMSERAGDGVVDPTLQVHGVANLHVCASSVFPTCSHANPTLMALALGCRLAQRLTRRHQDATPARPLKATDGTAHTARDWTPVDSKAA